MCVCMFCARSAFFNEVLRYMKTVSVCDLLFDLDSGPGLESN